MAGTSAARIEANRSNARKSTGPRTPEGKAKARANAVKHGLTGAGIALPTEASAMVEERFVGLQEEMAPRSLMGVVLVGKIALMSVRIERGARQEAAALATRTRRASVEFDLEREAEVDRLFDAIATNPRENHRRLLTTPEGVARLSEALRGVKAQLQRGLDRFWDEATSGRVEAFFGGSSDPFLVSRTRALLETLAGRYHWLEIVEIEHFENPTTRVEWARDELIGEVEDELEDLETIQAGFDLDSIERDRLEAGDRSLFDPGPDADRARKYEAAATRNFYQALREFRQDQAEHVEPSADAPINLNPEDEHEASDAVSRDEANVQADELDPEPADERLVPPPPDLQNEPNPGVFEKPPVLQNEPNIPRPSFPSQPEQTESTGQGIIHHHFY